MPAEPLLDQDTVRRLEQLTLVSRKCATGKRQGERRSRRRGASNEFADYRLYAAGDDLRFLDWKVYGRLERLFLKLFLEEEDLRVHVLLDASRSMQAGDPDKWLYARRVAAALGVVALSRMDSLVIQAFGATVTASYGPHRGKGNTPGCLHFLEGLAPAEGTALGPVFRRVAQTGGGRGLVIVISDFYDFEGYTDALRALFARDAEVLAIHVLSPQELDPAHQGDVRLVDVEFGHTTDVSMGRGVRDAYRRALNAFCGGLQQYLVARGGGYLLASTATPFDRLVLDVLRQRGVVR